MVFIGGGVGMAPLRAMIFEQLEGLQTTRKITFWYGARSRADLFYADELDGLAKRHDNFDWTVALSDPDPGDRWDGADRLCSHRRAGNATCAIIPRPRPANTTSAVRP